jgi:hypothetical protein
MILSILFSNNSNSVSPLTQRIFMYVARSLERRVGQAQDSLKNYVLKFTCL